MMMQGNAGSADVLSAVEREGDGDMSPSSDFGMSLGSLSAMDPHTEPEKVR